VDPIVVCLLGSTDVVKRFSSVIMAGVVALLPEGTDVEVVVVSNVGKRVEVIVVSGLLTTVGLVVYKESSFALVDSKLELGFVDNKNSVELSPEPMKSS